MSTPGIHDKVAPQPVKVYQNPIYKSASGENIVSKKNDVRDLVNTQGKGAIKDLRLPPLRDMDVQVIETERTVAPKTSGFQKIRDFFRGLPDRFSKFVADMKEKRAEKKLEAQAQADIASFAKTGGKIDRHNAIRNFEALSQHYSDRTAIRGIYEVVSAAIQSNKVVAEQNEFALKEKREIKENPSPKEIITRQLKSSLALKPSYADAMDLVDRMSKALDQTKSYHPNADARQIFKEALNDAIGWLKSEGVEDGWKDSFASAIMGSNADPTTDLLKHLKSFKDNGGNDVAGRFVDNIVKKFLVIKDGDFDKEKLNALKDALFKEVATFKTTAEAKNFVEDMKKLLEGLDKSHPNATSRSVFADAVTEFTKAFTSKDGMSKYTREEFKSELPTQIQTPGSFFRGNTSFQKGLMNVMRNDSPEVGKFITANIRDLANLMTGEFNELFKAVQKGESVDLEMSDGTTKSVKAEQVLGLKLAVKFFDKVYGTNEKEMAVLIGKMGPETKQLLVEFDRAINDFEGKKVNELTLTREDISTAVTMFNSNNLILRGLAERTSEVIRDLRNEGKKTEALALAFLQKVLTAAAGGVATESTGDSQYRGAKEFSELMGKIQGVLNSIVSVEIPKSLPPTL